MDDMFVGEIRAVGFGFAPWGWALCDGSLLAISQNQTLYAVLGNVYGSDGQNTFALPDLRGRAIVGAGAGPGLSPYQPGQRDGTESVALPPAAMPAHGHAFAGTIQVGGGAELPEAQDSYPATGPAPQFAAGQHTATLGAGSLPGALTAAGGSAPHENRQPSLVLTYAIALVGVFPAR
ncbi:phage tail protein [Hymenobacter bucti]|uniref:Phage tail protein n=1 Tax=Hymenobacter bucti TaxID=1844114 RepID=A0ABW4R280_9BACT